MDFNPRIGVLGCFYGCADLLPQVLAPWLALRQGFALPQAGTVVLGGINAQFAEYAALGYPNDDTATRATLEQYRPQFDFLRIEPQPQTEPMVRQQVLNFLLAQEVDLVWLLDGDEVYTQEQIQNILAYIEKTPQFDYYHVNFDNHVFGLQITDDFYPPRIFRTARRGGLAAFADDNNIEYADGRGLFNSVPGIIPKRVAHVLHHTWRLADAEKKIRYQQKHFGFSAFKLDHKGGWSPDPAFYAHIRRAAPVVAGNRVIAPPKAPLRVLFEITGTGEPERAALVTVLSALLGVERQNDYRIELLVRAPQELWQKIEELFTICPFSARLIGSEPVVSGADLFVVAPNDSARGAGALIEKIRERFPLLLG